MPRLRLEYFFIIIIFCVSGLILLRFSFPDLQTEDLNLHQLWHQVRNLENLVKESRNEIVLIQRVVYELERKKAKTTVNTTTTKASPVIATSVKKDASLLPERKSKFQRRYPADDKGFGRGSWPYPIAVLVFVCNRPTAIRNHLEKLIRYRPSREKFPIIVSQDCDDPNVEHVVHSFGAEVNYIKHLSAEKAGITASPEYKRYIMYYRISRHYKLGLSYVFDKLNHSSVIINEDDLDIAPDFFEYFSATRWLLHTDKTLYCVSAWNDNGKVDLIDTKQPELLHRSDFFPGLGWMLTKNLWRKLGPIWPSGFWDDWIRSNKIRKDRACIRPEISRTAMTTEGKIGASRGLFFENFLAKIVVNDVFVNFTKLNLRYLLKDNYDSAFLLRVYSAPLISVEKLFEAVSNGTVDSAVRIEYSTLGEYLHIANRLKIMRDFKEGVPRTAYLGVVTCFIGGVRIYVAPNLNTWQGYNPQWEAPKDFQL